MEFKQNAEEKSYTEQLLSGKPCINVIEKEDFEKRVKMVFDILWEKLSKSFGPGGAGTFISIYPAYYNTKDGYTIMKNIAFDNKLDQIICDMVSTICNRLNFTVGDGTTTATIATRSIYEAYLKERKYFTDNHILPREIIRRLESCKDQLLTLLDLESTPIRSDNPEELEKNIRAVVYVSSNGDQLLTDMICAIYKEMMCPAITVKEASDGLLKYYITSGYKIGISLTDKLYINHDDQTMKLAASDFLLFDHKVTKDTYECILKPMAEASKGRGRHLVCIAPFYDTVAMDGVIRKELNREYSVSNDINLVLAVCNFTRPNEKIALNDFAMLLHTQIITSDMEHTFIELLRSDKNIYDLFDLDQRNILGSTVCTMTSDYHLIPTTYVEGLENIFNVFDPELGIEVGYCDSAVIGLKEAIFDGFYYDEGTYKKYLKEAQSELEELKKKARENKLYGSNMIENQQRVNSLGLKYGVIEYGSTSDLTQGYLKDTIDDAIKAAASAYNNGVVLGCNVSLLRCIESLLSTTTDPLDKLLLNILSTGFKNVYKTVLTNVFTDDIIFKEDSGAVNVVHELIMITRRLMKTTTPFKDFDIAEDKFTGATSLVGVDATLHDVIVALSIANNEVFDLSDGNFTNMVINSTETDKEILKATIDLLSLLITGNQIVIR